MAKVTQDLGGQWEFREYPISVRRMRDLDDQDWQKANVPGSIFTSLAEAGQIDQRQLNHNPENFGWVSDKPWVYRRHFEISDEMLARDRIILVFEGLDTVARIWLNDKLIGKTENMFIRHPFDVTNVIKPGVNCLLIKLEPAVAYASRLMDRYGRIDTSGFSNGCRVYIRKAQYQFGWDFCPPLPGCGIWRTVRLEGIDRAAISDVHVRTVDCTEKYADVRIAVKLRICRSGQYVCRLNLSAPGTESEHRLIFDEGEDFHSTLIRIDKPALWWPAGYGRQSLYELQTTLYDGGKLIDQSAQHVGIRTVNLVIKPERARNKSDRSSKRKFEIQVNGQPIAVRGANWIPASMFPGSVSEDDYDGLLGDARSANMNMLRIWGGGYYENDRFYDVCDRLGILVWQDFMFACAYYPDRRWFIDQVKAEAGQIVRRLRNHPSLALWCGNNEIDWLHFKGELGKGKKFYGKEIYHKVLPKIVHELDPDNSYIPTTPLGNKDEFNSDSTLTTHQWQIWSGHKPARDYRCPSNLVPSFVTEFGMQSLPCLETLAESPDGMPTRSSDKVIEKRNYQVDGNARLYRYMGDLFGTTQDPAEFTYLSQVTQARGVKSYVEHLRAHRASNSGVLFWQFNDCNPAISWSAIDPARRPKALYYYARRFFANVLLAVVSEPEPTEAGFSNLLNAPGIVVVNDSPRPLTATLACHMIDMLGKRLDQVEFPVSVGPFSSTACLKLPRAFSQPDDPDRCAMHVAISSNQQTVARNLFLYLPDKYTQWPAQEISISSQEVKADRWKIILRSETLVKDVFLRSCEPDSTLRFSDNFFDLMPQVNHEVMVDCAAKGGSIEPALTLMSVNGVLSRTADSKGHQ